MAAKVTEEQEAAANGAAPEDVPVPGGVTTEELGTLYSAAKIELRAVNEQIEVRDKLLAGWNELGTNLMMLLGVGDLDAIYPAVEELTKNRQQRRSSKTPPKQKKPPAARGGKKAA